MYRYKLLISCGQQDVEMDKLRRKGILVTWVSFSTFSAVYLFTFLTSLISLGFPHTNITQNGMAYVVSVASAASNLPDIASIIVYIILWKHFNKSNSIGPTMPEHPHNQGEEEESISGVFPGGGVPGNPEHDRRSLPPIPKNKAGSTQETKKQAANTLRILRYHVLTSMVDVVFAVVALIPDLAMKRIAGFHLSVIVTFWIPLWVIKKNFKQMDNMVDSCWRIIC